VSAAPGNWGRWGPEDERGALNLLRPEVVRGAAGLVRHGVVTDLGQPLDPRMPVSVGRPPLSHFMTRDGGDYAAGGRRLGRSQFADDVVSLGTHSGTHVDALAHVWYDDHLYNGFPQETVRSTGAGRCGVERLGPIVGRGVLLDVAAADGRDALPAQFAVGRELLEAARDRAGVAVGAADVVLVRTGWYGATQGAGDGPSYFDGEPGLDADGAAWLAERDVAAVGADNYAIEALDARSTGGFPVHELLLRDGGIPLIEGLVLDALARAGVHEFLFVAAPLALRGATASPLAPIAVH
jgi:kynurenine formamidase